MCRDRTNGGVPSSTLEGGFRAIEVESQDENRARKGKREKRPAFGGIFFVRDGGAAIVTQRMDGFRRPFRQGPI